MRSELEENIARLEERKYLNVCQVVTINNIYRVLSVMPELPSLDLLLLRLAVPEHEHDHRLHRWGLELPVVRIGLVVEGDSVELALVDVGHLVVLSSHAAGGGCVQRGVEPERGEDLGDLNLLCVRVSTPIVVPRLSNCVLVEDVLGGVGLLGELEAGVAVHHASGGGDLQKKESCQWRKWGVCCMHRLHYMHLSAIIRGGISSLSRFSSLTG